MIKTIIKKIFGNRYKSVRKLFLGFYIPYLSKKLYRLEGELIMDNNKYYLKKLEIGEYKDLKFYYDNELSATDKSMGLHLSRQRLKRKDFIYFGLYSVDRITAQILVKIRGYRNVELGISVSKNFRRKGIGKNLIIKFEDILLNNKIDFFVVVEKKNKISLSFFKNRGYEIFKTKKKLFYLKYKNDNK